MEDKIKRLLREEVRQAMENEWPRKQAGRHSRFPATFTAILWTFCKHDEKVLDRKPQML